MLNVIDLFSGCGGFSYGFQKAGCNIFLGVDNDDDALATFKLNHHHSEVKNLDLFKKDSIQEISEIVDRHGGVDVLIAGPPCQGFSIAGLRNEKDKRNSLFQSVFSLVDRLDKKPKAIVIENVPGLATLYKGNAKKTIEEEFDRLGYSCVSQLLYAPHYGVPQIRRRLFFVGLQKRFSRFQFPEPILEENEFVTCEQAIGDLPSLENNIGSETSNYSQSPLTEYQKQMRKDCQTLHNHLGTRHSDLIVNVISQVPDGGNHKDLPPGVGESRKFNEAWTRYNSRKPSRTIDTGHHNHFHYRHNRVPTIRENARLQSFPDDFVFLGSKTQQNKQVGNAVPPLLGFHIASALNHQLLGLPESCES